MTYKNISPGRAINFFNEISDLIKSKVFRTEKIINILSEIDKSTGATPRYLPIDSISNIDFETMPKWHRFDLSKVEGVIYKKGVYSSQRFENISGELIQHEEVIETVDIQMIHGFGASKSPLHKFKTMEEMISQSGCKHMIDDVSHQGMIDNLSWPEIRIIKDKETSGDRLAYFAYFDCYYLLNSGGSHHFAAAKYIAKKLNVEIPIKGKVDKYWVNTSTVDILQERYLSIAIPLSELVNYRLQEQLLTQGVSYFHYSLESNDFSHDAWQIYFFPKSSKVSSKVYGAFIDNDHSIDLYKIISTLIDTQNAR